MHKKKKNEGWKREGERRNGKGKERKRGKRKEREKNDKKEETKKNLIGFFFVGPLSELLKSHSPQILKSIPKWEMS
jgi:hypothetical protein